VQRKAAKLGFDWSAPSQILEKIREELAELGRALKSGRRDRIEDELGDMLFSVVNLARFMEGGSSEEILAATTEKFQRRFAFIEKELAKRERTPGGSDIAEMEKLWRKAKRSERGTRKKD
jgi:uncharacterized protein YabN with tetrapyrrole methylase and pyrophosphatase domain